MKTKNYLALVLAIFLMPFSVFAVSGTATGQIESMQWNTEYNGDPEWNKIAWVKIEGVTAADGCIAHGGKVLFVIPSDDKGLLSMALTAFSTGKSVSVVYNDTKVNARNYCYVTNFYLSK